MRTHFLPLPTMPHHRHKYTCPNCGSHTLSNWRLYRDDARPTIVICGQCHEPYEWQPEQLEISWQEQREKSAEEEIREAIESLFQQD